MGGNEKTHKSLFAQTAQRRLFTSHDNDTDHTAFNHSVHLVFYQYSNHNATSKLTSDSKKILITIALVMDVANILGIKVDNSGLWYEIQL